MSKSILKSIFIEQLQRGQYQPRCEFDKESLEELAQSIKSSGLLQPLVVRPLAQDRYEIIAGERRWRAAQLAGFAKIDCLITDFTDRHAAEAATIENVQRANLNPIEEARAYDRLIKEFDYQHEEVASAVGKSRSAITNLLRILKLDNKVQDFIISGQISAGHGKPLAGVPIEQQLFLAQKCVSQNWSVRKLENEIRKSQSNISRKKNACSSDDQRLNRTLSDYIGCKVNISFEKNGGNGAMQIYFSSLEILDGIFEKIGFKYD